MTEHLPEPGQPGAGGRLAAAGSPYLRMHANDPVAWHTWGPEVFEEARAENKIIMLSCGYASCHWCHVMQRETFSNADSARLLGEHAIAVKVDRETRPDVDALYMAYVVATNGSGGWPMTVFLSPEGAPLLGATYLPPVARGDLPSFDDTLLAVAGAWRDNPAGAQATAADTLDFLRNHNTGRADAPVTRAMLDMATEAILHDTDQRFGGFKGAPKFPQACAMQFLLAYYQLTHEREAFEQPRLGVEAMIRSGTYDQVEGGLFRYATDAAWLVPHFEKMLYDNAQLLMTIARLIRSGGTTDELLRTARTTAEFLRTRLGMQGGGFLSSLDADTAGVEGATYVWDYTQLEAVLSPEQLELAEIELGVSRDGNWNGHSIIERRMGRTDNPDAVDDVLATLAKARAERDQPRSYDNIVVAWNALAARGLIEAGAATGDEAMLELGMQTVSWLLEHAIVGNHEVLRCINDDDVADVRLADDAAALTAACLTAAENGGDAGLLATARALHERSVHLFSDGGVVYATPANSDLPVRPYLVHDEPTPSAPSLMAENAVRLANATGEATFAQWAERVIEYAAGAVGYAPQSVAYLLLAKCALEDWAISRPSARS